MTAIAAGVRRGLTRWQASGLHLLASAAIAMAVLAIMLGVWYPRPLFDAEGGLGLVFILVCVNVVSGPLLTLIIFKPGKPGLRFDLSVIAAMQLLALLYGVHVVFVARPVFLVLVKGQFEVVAATELKSKWLEEPRRPEFRSLPVTGPVLVAFDWPTDKEEEQVIIRATLFGGRDAQLFPRYYVPYAERAREVLAGASTIERVRKSEPHTAHVIDEYLSSSGRTESEVRYFAMRTRSEWIAVLVDATSGEVVKMLLVPNP